MTSAEIVKALRCGEDANGTPRTEPSDGELVCYDTLKLAAAELIERLEKEKAAAQWVPTTDRLPDEREPVIILLKDGQVFRGEIRKRIALPEWWYFYDAADTDMDMLGIMYPVFNDGFWMHENPVVAWMPLPKAPEVD